MIFTLMFLLSLDTTCTRAAVLHSDNTTCSKTLLTDLKEQNDSPHEQKQGDQAIQTN